MRDGRSRSKKIVRCAPATSALSLPHYSRVAAIFYRAAVWITAIDTAVVCAKMKSDTAVVSSKKLTNKNMSLLTPKEISHIVAEEIRAGGNMLGTAALTINFMQIGSIAQAAAAKLAEFELAEHRQLAHEEALEAERGEREADQEQYEWDQLEWEKLQASHA